MEGMHPLHLTLLGTAEAEELLSFLLGRDASLQRLKILILEKTEGTLLASGLP